MTADDEPTDGDKLARAYYEHVVEPLLAQQWPGGLPHAAGRLGGGSDVLGLDDAVSRDHDWGLRLTLLVDEGARGSVDAYLADALPESFGGWPTQLAFTGETVAAHAVEVASPEGFAPGTAATSSVHGSPPPVWWASPCTWASCSSVAGRPIRKGEARPSPRFPARGPWAQP